jgi:hypothetical protein
MTSWCYPGFCSKLLWAEKYQFKRWKNSITPGFVGDKDQRRFLFDRWVNRPSAAKRLYWKLKK